MNTYHLMSKKDVLEHLKVDPVKGLSTTEAKYRLEKYGENKLKEQAKKSLVSIFFSQLNDALIYVLLAAAGITIAIHEYIDGFIILVVVLINAGIGVFQEYKADQAVAALKRMTSPSALVKRDGKITEIPSEQIVPGDLLVLDAGRYVLADMRLIESANLQIEEASLTGESIASDKDANVILEEQVSLGDRKNMAYLSTLVTYGRGTGIVTATGMDTEIGAIATMLNEETEHQTPLQIRLSKLGKTLGLMAIGVCVMILIIGMLQSRPIFELFLTAISLAVAAIPEGLAAIVAIVLALGITRMTQKNAIVKKLPAVETLGSVDIVCSDKTGTLTQNKMTVVTAYTNSGIAVRNDGQSVDENDEFPLLAKSLMLSSDATYENGVGTGDPTEIALIELGVHNNIMPNDLHRDFIRKSEIPFDSKRKIMSTLTTYEQHYAVFAKGAIDELMRKCTHVQVGDQALPLTEERQREFLDKAESMSQDALRVLASAYKIVDGVIAQENMEQGLIFIGFVGMIDPPRLEVKQSIERAKKAGITTIMITGDHKTTAYAIGKELGIIEDMAQAISGKELDDIPEHRRIDVIPSYRIFARVSPEHKVMIVKAFKANKHIVSMTGDGVNDAPSLKAADIGVAMGITGTDVSKSASDMILTDDDFSTIIVAIEEGRNIYNNIKKSIHFLLSCNLGEIVTLTLAMLFKWPLPLIPTQILWVNLITDSFPAIALGVDTGKDNIMNDPPRPIDEDFFTRKTKRKLISGGFFIGVLTLIAFVIGMTQHGVSPFASNVPEQTLRYARTMAFLTLSATQLFLSLSLRNHEKNIWQIGLWTNKKLIGAIVLGIVMQLAVVMIPFLQNAFKLVILNPHDWLIVTGLSLLPFLSFEAIKWGKQKKAH